MESIETEQNGDEASVAPQQKTSQKGKIGLTHLGYFNLEDPPWSTPHNLDQDKTHQRRYRSEYSDEEEPFDQEETQQRQQPPRPQRWGKPVTLEEILAGKRVRHPDNSHPSPKAGGNQ